MKCITVNVWTQHFCPLPYQSFLPSPSLPPSPRLSLLPFPQNLLRDFTHHHVDMVCLFLEHCGRFLLRSPDSHLRAKALLEILLRKKKVGLSLVASMSMFVGTAMQVPVVRHTPSSIYSGYS